MTRKKNGEEVCGQRERLQWPSLGELSNLAILTTLCVYTKGVLHQRAAPSVMARPLETGGSLTG